jgi:hypothetical protein
VFADEEESHGAQAHHHRQDVLIRSGQTPNHAKC